MLNYFLSIAAFIALVVVVYGFYLMFFSEQEAGFTKAKKMLRGAVLALIIIGLSRSIISFLFGVFGVVSNPRGVGEAATRPTPESINSNNALTPVNTNTVPSPG